MPLSLANALQPVLIGQAISLIRQEPVAWFLEGLTMQSGLNLLIVLLMVTVAIRLVLDGFQSYLVQEVGQNITADIRYDLFTHVTSLAVRFFDRTPVGKLITPPDQRCGCPGRRFFPPERWALLLTWSLFWCCWW